MIESGYQPVVGEGDAIIISEIFKATYIGIRKSLNWVKEKKHEHDFFNSKAHAYAKHLVKRHDVMRVFGMSGPRKLRDIFVKVNILEEITDREYLLLNSLRDQFDKERHGFNIKKHSKLGIEIVEHSDKLIVLGKPGSGKSTFLKRILFYALDDELSQKRLPIFISLKDYSESGLDLLDFITSEFDICQFPDAKPFILRILKQGKALILIDGLDEVSKESNRSVVKNIKGFVDKFQENQFIISCRIAAYNAIFEQFIDVEMADFNDKQIEEFIIKWFQENDNLATSCWEQMKSDKQIKELAKIPLLLTLLCITYGKLIDFPLNRAELYEEGINALLKEWDVSRSIKRWEIYKGLSYRRKKNLLSKIAFETFRRSEFFLKDKQWAKYIREFIINLQNVNEESVEIDSQDILQAIVAQHGVIVPRARHIYSFSHLTFQEFFVARYLADNVKHLPTIVNKYILDDQWREVFILIAEMLEEADDFFSFIQKEIDQFGTDNNLQIFLKIDEVINPHSDYDFVGSRALIIYYALSDAFAHSIDYRITKFDEEGMGTKARPRLLNSSIVLIEEFILSVNSKIAEKFQNLSHQTRLKADQEFALSRKAKDSINSKRIKLELEIGSNLEFAKKIVRDFSQVKELKKEIPDAGAVYKYIKMNKLLLDCLQTECYLSKGLRNNLKTNLFSLKKNE